MTLAIETRNASAPEAHALPPVQRSTAPADSSTDSGASSISSNDFLTLLVTEMKNQDPTADTDPNEYINQLVNVNSLEQLISINQELSGASASSDNKPGSMPLNSFPGPSSSSSAPRLGAIAGNASLPSSAPPSLGNLSAPSPSAAAERVAHALSGIGIGH